MTKNWGSLQDLRFYEDNGAEREEGDKECFFLGLSCPLTYVGDRGGPLRIKGGPKFRIPASGGGSREDTICASIKRRRQPLVKRKIFGGGEGKALFICKTFVKEGKEAGEYLLYLTT